MTAGHIWRRGSDAWIGDAVPDAKTHAYFWFRSRKRGPATIVCVFKLGRIRRGGRIDTTGRVEIVARYTWAYEEASRGKGWWAGPIADPEEPMRSKVRA